MRHLLIRADASNRMGSGHLMRCLALSHAWKAQGGGVTFLSHCESSALRDRVEDSGYRFVSLARPHPDQADLEATLLVLSELGAGSADQTGIWVVLDGYHFEPVYQQAVRTAGYRLLVIDDMAHLPYYHANMLLNQNIHAEELTYHCDSDTVLLLGLQYALLQPAFLAWHGWQRDIPAVAHKVLITMGGGDADNVTLKVIQALAQVEVGGLEAVVVVGAINPHYRQLQGAVERSQWPVRLERDVPNMAELMAWADVAVSAGGTTCWELAFMSLPHVVTVLAENQVQVAEALHNRGIAINMGRFTTLNEADLAQVMSNLMLDEQQRREMSCRGRQAVDGLGAERVTGIMAAQFGSL